MKATLMTCFIGLILSSYLALNWLGLETPELGCALLAANAAAFVSVFTTLRIEKTRFLKAIPLPGWLKSWSLLTLIYSVTLLSLSPAVRSTLVFLTLFLPLILSTGPAILVFGMIQDHLYRKQQRRLKRSAQMSETATLPS